MDFSKWLTDERLLANLIGVHVALAVLLVAAIIFSKMLKNGGELVARSTYLSWLGGVSGELVKGARSMVFWSAVALMVLAIAASAVYHATGRDVRMDFNYICDQITATHIITAGTILGELVLVAVGMSLTFRMIRRARLYLEVYAHHHLPKHLHPEAQAGAMTVPLGEHGPAEHRQHLEQTIKHWFQLVERFGMALTILGGLWLVAHIVGIPNADGLAHLVLKILTIFTVARLVTLGCRSLFHVVANVGNRRFDKGHIHRYWERTVRLFPLGERCFEAAVWIFAASECAETLSFIKLVAQYGPKVVACIGIFYCTRVIIELLHVFINQAFGMYNEDRTEDQKGQTLVPLLESVSRYGLYFNSVLMMLHALGYPTTPILASAGVVGLAIGLGAQSFVSDVVSGFFILFEEQYFVGDIVQIGDAAGRVEAINIRHTQIRDESGKLYIIPNGQIKTVVNFSKDYVNAVVEIKVPTTTNLEQVMRDMAEAGKRLRNRRREVMADTVIRGLVDLTPSDMVIRAVTKVQPGTHLAMQQEYRKTLKEVFDESARAASKGMAA